MAKQWLKLTKSGVAFGLAYFEGDVVELDAEIAKKVMSGAGGVPAEAGEIEAAKEAIVRADAKERAANAEKGPSNADLLAKIEELQNQLSEKDKNKK